MCKRTNKILFCGGLGLALLIYYCATTFPDINILNPKGGRLELMNQMTPEEVKKLKRTDAYLDSCTGDYYGFNTE